MPPSRAAVVREPNQENGRSLTPEVREVVIRALTAAIVAEIKDLRGNRG